MRLEQCCLLEDVKDNIKKPRLWETVYLNLPSLLHMFLLKKNMQQKLKIIIKKKYYGSLKPGFPFFSSFCFCFHF